MKSAELVVDLAMIAVALAVGVGYAVLSVVRFYRDMPKPRAVAHRDAPSALTWSDLVTADEVQAAARVRMLARFDRIAATMPDVRDQIDLYPAAEEMSQ